MKLPLEPAYPRIRLQGGWAERMRRNVDQWLLPAPQANPAMLEMFRLQDRMPRVPLVPWYGEFPGKYLCSAALAYRITGSRALRAVADSLVEDLVSVRSPEGYLGPHPKAERLTGSTEGEKKRRLWDVWGHYHVLLGLLLWHEATGNEAALSLCTETADHLCREFLGREKGILEAEEPDKNTAVIHVLCLLYGKTGKPAYLSMARSIERSREDPQGGGYLAAGLRGTPFHETALPRWESLHAVQGIFELHRITGEAGYGTAIGNLWWSIVRGDRHNTGGFGSGERARGNPYDPRPIETCCTVAWMAMSVDMLRLSGDSYVADELELSAWNATLGAQHPSGRWWTYNTPMDGVRKASAHAIVFQAIQGSPELNCCSVNGPRGLGIVADWALMRCPGGLALNFYGPCTLCADLESGRSLTIRQKTRYPSAGTVRLEMGLERSEEFTLKLRIPGWSAATKVLLNGVAVDGVEPGRYLSLARPWRDGDVVEILLDMGLHFWTGERECGGKVSLYRGPILLAYDQRFNEFDPDRVPAVERSSLRCSPKARASWPRPMVLVSLRAAGGRDLHLCDFATAGATGGRYLSWLPAVGFHPTAFQPGKPEWFDR